MAILNSAEKALPAGLRAKLAPLGAKVAVLLSGRDEVSRAQRMALVAFAVRIASAGIAFISQIILARLMGEFEYGLFAFVWVLVILFGNLSCLGFHTTVIRFLPGYRLEEAHDKIMGLTSTARVFAMLAASALAISVLFSCISSASASLPIISSRLRWRFSPCRWWRWAMC
jgi:O-antigen/teichoic acid export membrane protein